MISITLPFWLIITAIGIPTITLAWLIGTLVHRRRKKRTQLQPQRPAQWPQENGQGAVPFHQDLYLRQIDAVFDGLTALIETERIKLKRMLAAHASCDPAMAAAVETVEQPASEQSIRIEEDEQDNVAESCHTDLHPNDVEKIASQFGVSAAEAELAIKLNNLSKLGEHRRLEAVA